MSTANNAAVLDTLRDARPQLIDSALDVLSASQRTLLNQALARSFVDAYLDAVADQHPAQLAVWIEAKSAIAAHDRHAASFLSDASRALAEYVEGKEFGDVAVAPLRVVILSEVFSPERDAQATQSKGEGQAAKADARTGLVTDVDGAINEVVTRLSVADLYAGDHARQVSAWSKRIARNLGLSEDDVAFAGRAALIHDMGELTLPAGIVSAARPLHDGEVGLVRTHVLAGEAQAEENPLLAPFASAIRSHHERFDGGGYPDRARGDAIPIAARIIAVADSFNAMVGRRPHRAPITAPEALDRLRLGAGTQFDPAAVKALDAVLNAR